MTQPNLWHNKLSDVDDSAQVPIGVIRSDEYGNEFIYLLGVANVAVGSWVSFTITSRITGAAVALLAANAVGQVGIAMGAIIAGKYGWFQIDGFNAAAKALASCAAGKILYGTSTAGSVDDAVVVGDKVYGAVSSVAISGGVIGVTLSHPMVTNESN